MIVIFGAIPFTDAMIVRFVDDRMRSRVSGMRLFVSFGVSSTAVWLLGPVVKAAGFSTLLWSMAGIATRHAVRGGAAAADRCAAASQRAGGTAAAIASRSGLKTPGAAAITSLRAHELEAAREVADAAPRLDDEQRAGGDVPRIEAHLPEAVEPARGDVGEVERAGARPPNAGAFRTRARSAPEGSAASFGAAVRWESPCRRAPPRDARTSTRGSACR